MKVWHDKWISGIRLQNASNYKKEKCSLYKGKVFCLINKYINYSGIKKPSRIRLTH